MPTYHRWRGISGDRSPPVVMSKSTGRRGSADQQRTQLLLAAVQELYASAMAGTPEIWHQIYQQCTLLLESEAGGFISTDKVNQAADIASLVGFDQERAIRAYREYGVEVDLLFMGTLTMGAGSTFLGTEKIGFRALQRSPFYGILSAPLGLRFVCGGILENDERHHSALYFWRRADQADFDQASMGDTRRRSCRTSARPSRCSGGSVVPSSMTMPAGSFTLHNFEASRHGIFILDDRRHGALRQFRGRADRAVRRRDCHQQRRPQRRRHADRRRSRTHDVQGHRHRPRGGVCPDAARSGFPGSPVGRATSC